MPAIKKDQIIDVATATEVVALVRSVLPVGRHFAGVGPTSQKHGHYRTLCWLDFPASEMAAAAELLTTKSVPYKLGPASPDHGLGSRRTLWVYVEESFRLRPLTDKTKLAQGRASVQVVITLPQVEGKPGKTVTLTEDVEFHLTPEQVISLEAAPGLLKEIVRHTKRR